MPDQYWLLFRINRHLLKIIPKTAAHTVINICKNGKKRKHYLPGIFLVIHSFGRDAKYNLHIHLSLTFGGFQIKNGKTSNKYIKGTIIKNIWKYHITNILRTQYKKKNLIPYPAVAHHVKNLTSFNKWLDSHYQ